MVTSSSTPDEESGAAGEAEERGTADFADFADGKKVGQELPALPGEKAAQPDFGELSRAEAVALPIHRSPPPLSAYIRVIRGYLLFDSAAEPIPHTVRLLQNEACPP